MNMSNIIEFDSTHIYNNDIINRSCEIPIIIKFSASWCKPCKTVDPIYNNLANEHKSFIFYKIDIDDFEELQEIENVTTIPYFILYKDGVKIYNESAGTEEKVLMFIEKCEKYINENKQYEF